MGSRLLGPTGAHRSRRARLGEFRLRGRWYVAPERVDLNLEIDRTLLGEMTALLRGQAGGVHGRISARLHLAGPIDQIGIAGRLNIEDVHRWDLMPPYGQGWPLDVRGRLNLPGQDLEIESGSVNGAALPLEVRLHASNYLAQPRWRRRSVGIVSRWAAAGTGAAYGLEVPPKLELDGAVDGAVGYSGAAACKVNWRCTTQRSPFRMRRRLRSIRPASYSMAAMRGWRPRWCAPRARTRRKSKPIMPSAMARSISRSPPAHEGGGPARAGYAGGCSLAGTG